MGIFKKLKGNKTVSLTEIRQKNNQHIKEMGIACLLSIQLACDIAQDNDYHWACVENRINPEKNIGDLNDGVVMERRKGLEWLVSEFEDWNEFSLDT